MSRTARTFCCAVLLLCLTWSAVATAQGERSLPPLEQVKYLIALGLLEDAEDVLDRFLQTQPDDIEGRFLKAAIAVERKRWADAAAIYRGILAQHPDELRIRLEYARALFEEGEDREADFNFRLALPHVPEAVAANIYTYLNEIAARKRFSYSLLAGISPDTNINAASAIDQLTLFGLPFTNTGNKPTSSVGVVIDSSGELRFPLAGESGPYRMRLGGVLYRAEYFGGHAKFDDMIARIYAGPQYLFSGGDASLLAIAGQRWFGNDPYNWSYGPHAEFNYFLTDNLYLRTNVEYTPVQYHTQTFQNGHLLTGLASATYVLSPASSVSLITGVAKEHDASPDFSNLSYRIGLGYQRELPFGISLYVEPNYVLVDYTAPSPSFGTTRRDRLTRLQLTVSKRDIRWWGFWPSLTYNFTEDDSNQPIFSFTRHQLIIGLATSF